MFRALKTWLGRLLLLAALSGLSLPRPAAAMIAPPSSDSFAGAALETQAAAISATATAADPAAETETLILEDADGGLWLAAYVGQNPHNGASVYVLSPTGLDVVEPGVWQVEQGESLWSIYKILHARGAGDAPSWEKFLENVVGHVPGRDMSKLQVGQLIQYRDPAREKAIAQMAKEYLAFRLATARSETLGGKLTEEVLRRLEESSHAMGEVAEIVDTGAVFSHSLSRSLGLGLAEMKTYNWNTFRTAFAENVGPTTKLGQSIQWARFKQLTEIAEKAEKVGKVFPYLDVALSAVTLGNAVVKGEGVGDSLKLVGASAGTAGLAATGSRLSPWTAVPWAAYYMTMELHDAQDQRDEAQRAFWEGDEAQYRLLRYIELRRKLLETK